MSRILITFFLSLAAVSAAAQESPPAPPEIVPEEEMGEGLDLMEEGAKLLLRGLMSEMEPAIDEMGKALTEMEPAVTELMRMIGDFRNYHAPEMLENGDIIIRRKTPLVPAPETGPKGEIDL
jgi:hypothetical protein